MKKFRIIFTWLAVAMLAVTTACGEDDPIPVEPEKPTTPSKPDDPDDPEEPDDPNDPAEPEDPTDKRPFSVRWNPNLSFKGEIITPTLRYNILLPQEYFSNPDAKFPVMYLFHGYGDDITTWGSGHSLDIQSIDASAVAQGLTGPVIYVMPQGWNSYFVNRYNGDFMYMDMLTKEFIPMIDDMLPTIAEPRGRAVAGFSMGGFGALSAGGKYPNVFGTCIGLSPSMNTDQQYMYLGGWDSQWGSNFGGSGTTGEARLTDHYKMLCPLHFFNDDPVSNFTNLRILFDCGDEEERIYEASGELHNILRDRGIRHEYRVGHGGHSGSYAKNSLIEGMALFREACYGIPFPDETPISITKGSAPAPKVVSAGNAQISVYTGSYYKNNDNTRLICVEIGSCPSSLNKANVASMLANTLSRRNTAVAIVETPANCTATSADFFSAVESALGRTFNDDKKYIIVAGDNISILGSLAWTAPVASFAAYDTNLTFPDGAKATPKLTFLDITDGGKNYKNMLNLFCTVRNTTGTDATKTQDRVEYRVHNGSNNDSGAESGVANIINYMNTSLPTN